MKPIIASLSILLSALLLISIASSAQSNSTEIKQADICLSPTEKILAGLINEYRKEKRLPEVPVSRALTYVGKVHARDLMLFYKQSYRCNMHSWSDNGTWSACCYTEDHRRASCMWNKPRELTSYPGNGYEIAFYSNYPYNSPSGFAEDILNGWKKSKGHNEIIVNRGKWKTSGWKAMGIGVYGNYAVVWFGELADEAGEPPVCAER